MVFSGLYGWAAVCQRLLFTKHHQLHREQIKSAAPRSSSCLKCYGRTTYLEPLYQLQWLAVILVCFEDDICQLMYDHIQRALVFNRFGEIKLGKKKKKKTFINIWRMWGSLPKEMPSHWASALHTAFILTCYPNPWQLIFHWMPGNFTQIFTSQQCTPNSMKRHWNCCKHPSSEGLPVLLLLLETVFPSLLSSLYLHIYAMQKDWAIKNYH